MLWMMVVMWKSLLHIHTHEWMNDANENVMYVGLLKGFLNRTLINERVLWGWYTLWVKV